MKTNSTQMEVKLKEANDFSGLAYYLRILSKPPHKKIRSSLVDT